MTYILNNILDHSFEGIGNNLEIIYNSKNKYIKMLNNSKKIFLDEIILNIFETKINIYFDSIPFASDELLEKYYPKVYLDKINKINNNNAGILLDQSLRTLEKYLDYLELVALGKKKKNNSHIIKLYALTYVKIYLSKLVNYIKIRNNKLLDISGIMKIIEGKKNNSFRKVIKIYIFKLLYSDMNNFEEFKAFNFADYNIDFVKDFNFDCQNKEGEESMLNYAFLPLDNSEIYQKYLKQFNQFEVCRKSQFDINQTRIYANYIRENGIDMFLDMSINKVVSNLGFKNPIPKKVVEYQNYSLFCKKLFTSDYIFKNEVMNNLLSLFLEENTYNSRLKPLFKQGNFINQKLLEIVLYGFRYCVSSLSARDEPLNVNKTLLYESLLTKDCINNLNVNYIPGCDLIDDLHIITFEYIKDHLENLDDKHGCYVCRCGYYYLVEPCGFPTRGNTSKCPICGLKIGWGEKVVNRGWGDHGMIIRPGHYRIYKDKEQKRICESYFGDTSENIPNKTLEEYKRDVIDPILDNGKFGLNIVSKEFFLRTDKNIRNLSEISFRLLHFIAYSHLFFSNVLGFVSEYSLQNHCLVKKMTCLEIIEKDWEILKEVLQKNEIPSIQIFMNLIFSRVSKVIKECPYCIEENDRNNIEKQVEEIVNQGLKEYKNYSKKYEGENKKQLNLNYHDMKIIICEIMPPNEKIYKKKDFPLLKYFMLTKYKSFEEFIQKLGPINLYITKYPLIAQYLLNNPGPKKLKYLPQFNEFTNYMIDNYSFKISRDDAKQRILEKEEIFNEPNFKNKFNNFVKIWKNIKNEARKYKFRAEMPIKDLSQKDTLNYFLNDDAELEGGMYIASAYQNFIFWQNSFLQPIIDIDKHNGILHYYVNNLQRKIPIQNARANQTLFIEDCFSHSPYRNFIELVYTFSKRNIFRDDGTINYINYNSFIYNYDKVEEEFGKLLLPGLCLFEDEDKLNFVTYWSECFRGGRSDTLKTFYEKYPQKSLNNNEKKIITNYINSIISGNNYYDFKEFFGSLQLLIFYLSNNDVKKDDKISNILNDAPPYLKISNDCLHFFNNEGNQFILDKLMNIFFFIEHLCFYDLIESLQPEYRMEISDEIIKEIKAKLILDKNPYKNYKYTVSDLAAAVRRFISRYLVGKRQIDIDEKMDLIFDLSRADLWDEKIGKLENLEDLLGNQLNEFGLKVGHAFAFYQLIEEEDKIDSLNNNDNINNNNNSENQYDNIDLDVINTNEQNNNIILENNNFNNNNDVNIINNNIITDENESNINNNFNKENQFNINNNLNNFNESDINNNISNDFNNMNNMNNFNNNNFSNGGDFNNNINNCNDFNNNDNFNEININNDAKNPEINANSDFPTLNSIMVNGSDLDNNQNRNTDLDYPNLDMISNNDNFSNNNNKDLNIVNEPNINSANFNDINNINIGNNLNIDNDLNHKEINVDNDNIKNNDINIDYNEGNNNRINVDNDDSHNNHININNNDEENNNQINEEENNNDININNDEKYINTINEKNNNINENSNFNNEGKN